MPINEADNSIVVPHLGGVNLTLDFVNANEANAHPSHDEKPKHASFWMPQRAIFTSASLDFEHGHRILERCETLGIPVEKLKSNRLTNLRADTVRATYAAAKRTLAVVVAPPSHFKLTPIPPSADWQFHLAEGCPAHCQYCYLAGSLSGPPVVRAYANLPQILKNLEAYETKDETTFEVSCYTDPLGIEHLTGSLAECIKYFGTRNKSFLRYVSKFDAVEELIGLPHNGQTRARASVNAAPVSNRLEGGTANVRARLQALRKMALPLEKGGGNYPVGLVIAPIMPIDNWQAHYSSLLDDAAAALNFPCDLTFELISHRFTPGSKDVLLQWYPNTSLDLDESKREVKRNKFGGQKYVYPRETMKELRSWFEAEINMRFPEGKILYWT
jgi:spore photoproduct lyase